MIFQDDQGVVSGDKGEPPSTSNQQTLTGLTFRQLVLTTSLHSLWLSPQRELSGINSCSMTRMSYDHVSFGKPELNSNKMVSSPQRLSCPCYANKSSSKKEKSPPTPQLQEGTGVG